MLEEQLRELEMRGEDQLMQEQKRCRELLARVEREKQLEIENYQVRFVCSASEKRPPESLAQLFLRTRTRSTKAPWTVDAGRED
jgi:hypothetical protein